MDLTRVTECTFSYKYVSCEFYVNYASASLYYLMHRFVLSMQRPKKQDALKKITGANRNCN